MKGIYQCNDHLLMKMPPSVGIIGSRQYPAQQYHYTNISTTVQISYISSNDKLSSKKDTK
jgi:hypothetical protein